MKEEHVVLLVRVRMEQAFETLEDARTLLLANGSPRSVINRA
jgi:hypothetical protein